ncbi:MAG: 4Fe-4S binding protein [Deltaproteobacteria bacterium]|nr:4Fe-4S binding protein [Deltaproteobacteria bacterium]
MNDIPDLSVSVAGVRFKSPVLAASSECSSDVPLIEKLAGTAAGGIVTKTFTSREEHKVRVRPYQFPLQVFGKDYKEGNCLLSLAAPHVEDIGPWLDKISRMAEICRASSMPLIASYFEVPENLPLWIRRARAFEKAGADMIELNFSCPHTSRVFHQGFEVPIEIISRVKEHTSIPVGLKIGPTLEPLESFIASLHRASPDFITAHNAPGGILIDVEKEVPFGAPAIEGYVMGRAFLPYSLARIVRIRRESDIPLIGIGGIGAPRDALQYLLCGCHLAGIGSGLYFGGFEILDRIHRGISAWMKNKGYRSIDEFRGKVLHLITDPATLGAKEKYPFVMPPECPYVPVVDESKCNLCRACEKACIYDVFRMEAEKEGISVDESRCWSCGFCVGICPGGAIELRDRRYRERVIWNNQGTAIPFQ